jgi:hypothetical protein
VPLIAGKTVLLGTARLAAELLDESESMAIAAMPAKTARRP